MAWPKLRKSRSRAPLVTFSNRGEASAPGSGEPGSGESVRLIWPSGNPVGGAAAGADGRAGAAGPSGPAGPSVAAEAAADPDDLPIWDWGADQSELDDPSDAFAPDRPEYPDGPDYPDYRTSAGAEPPPLVVPASAWTDGSRRDGGSSRSSQSSRPGRPGQDRGLRRPREPVVSTLATQEGEPREGIGQHLGSLAHLSGDPMKRAWVWRTVIAIAIFAIVTGFSDGRLWLVGLTLAVLAVIADTIFRARWAGRMGPAGARQTAAQQRTRRQVAKLRRAGYRCLHGGAIAGSDDLIDHLVIGPAGVFSIDSEAWDRQLPVRTSKGTRLWHGPFSMKDRLEHARWESERASTQLSGALGTHVAVRPAMAVYGPKIPWDVVTISGVDVFSGPKLRRYLRHVARQSDTRLLSDSEIERIEQAARMAFPQAATG